jgi:hypothetical protein
VGYRNNSRSWLGDIYNRLNYNRESANARFSGGLGVVGSNPATPTI